MSTPQLCYLDHAATTAFRPPSVVHAVTEYLEQIGATPGRGGHRLAIAADRVVLRCRQALAQLLDIPGDPGRLVFTHNATHALNMALRGVLRPGDRLVVTDYDHNAVRRPAWQLHEERGIEVVRIAGDANGGLDEAALARALEGARLLVLNGASNVLGCVPDLTDLIARAHDAGALVLLDGAQLLGHVPFSAARTGVDLLALTGHKGLLGPQGTGALWVSPGVDVAPLLSGGTGGDSRLRSMPPAYPDHLEAGTLNGPGIAGLAAGAELLLHHSVERLHEHLGSLKAMLHDGLAAVPGVRVRSPLARGGVPIVTLTAANLDPATVALRLDREHGVLVRAGLHCAPDAHRLIGTLDTGAVRFSLGFGSTEADVEQALHATAAVVSASQPG